MTSWLVWTVLAAVAVILGAVGYHFSLRTLRWIALIIAGAIAAYLLAYGLTHPAQKPGSLSDAFARGAGALSSALIRPLSFGHVVPVPGRIGWLVIAVLLVLGYRALEAWAFRRQAPCLNLSELTSDRQDNAADRGADGGADAQTGKLRHDWLVAELKFRLPAVEVRAPAILPGGSRPSGLASIAEATGVSGAGLAGAIIRFFGMVWPSSPQIQVRAWVERTPGHTSVDDVTRVTVGLADSRSGTTLATKTLAAGDLDAVTAEVAGYVARHIFARDRTVPPWSASATDGADLAALLRARQERGYPECRHGIRGAWDAQIELLEGVARGNLCAGVVRYELAQLYNLRSRHVAAALLLHAANREQYPRFYRGKYRLAMSLEMLANPHSGLGEIDMSALKEALRILDRCHVTENVADNIPDGGQAVLPEWLRPCLLAAAQKELQDIQRYLTRRHIIWRAFRHRDERSVLRPYRRRRHRQAFHDGVCVALLLVAVRQALMARAKARAEAGAKAGAKDGAKDGAKGGAKGGAKDRAGDVAGLPHAGTIARIVAAISGGSADFADVLDGFPVRRGGQQSIHARLRTRRWPRQCSTPSWPAAYNLACAYAALAADPCATAKLDHLVGKVVDSLEFAICNPECEMERPSEWIGNDPDFDWLCQGNERFLAFLEDQRKRDYPADLRCQCHDIPAEGQSPQAVASTDSPAW